MCVNKRSRPRKGGGHAQRGRKREEKKKKKKRMYVCTAVCSANAMCLLHGRRKNASWTKGQQENRNLSERGRGMERGRIKKSGEGGGGGEIFFLSRAAQSCISSGISCGLRIPGTSIRILRFSSSACRNAASRSSRKRSLSSSPVYSLICTRKSRKCSLKA